jgi:hypothetical protein
MLHSRVGSWPYPQTLGWATVEIHAREKHSSLLQKFVNYGCKKLYNILTRGQCYITFSAVIYESS